MRQWLLVTTLGNPDVDSLDYLFETIRRDGDKIEIKYLENTTSSGPSENTIELYRNNVLVGNNLETITNLFQKEYTFKLPEVDKETTSSMLEGFSKSNQFNKMVKTAIKYISSRYNNICVLDASGEIGTAGYEITGLQYDTIANQIIINKKFPTEFTRCFSTDNTARFVIIRLSIKCIDGGRHANMILYDKQKSTMERFEPQGYYFKNCTTDIMDQKILQFFNTIPKKYGSVTVHKYYKPVDFCPKISFQFLQHIELDDEIVDKLSTDPGGFCFYWSMWYVELRALNPDVGIEALQTEAITKLKENEKSFTDFIRRYAGIIHQYYKKSIVLEEE